MRPETPKRWLAGWLGLALAVVAIDQASKAMVMESMALGDSQPVTAWFNLVYVLNPGAAFSFLSDGSGWQRWFFTLLALAVVLVLVVLIHLSTHQRLFCLGASLVVGGALGNLLDRLRLGAVVDFLDLFWRHWHWPAFNVADMAITAGAMLLVLDELLRARRGSQE